MKLFSPAISRLARFRNWHIEHWMSNPIATQREVLQDLVTHGQYTEFGRKYGFKELFNIRKFKEHVPIHEYEDLKPYIDRLMQGDENMTWNTPSNWFAKSSGTTNDKSKFIPITKESLENCHFQGAKDVLTLYYNYNNDSDLLTGKGLVIGGSHQISKVNEDVQFGDLSAVLLHGVDGQRRQAQRTHRGAGGARVVGLDQAAALAAGLGEGFVLVGWHGASPTRGSRGALLRARSRRPR